MLMPRLGHLPPARLLGRVIEGVKQAPLPGFIEPCCPTPRKVPPSGDGWLHEIKHDGYRAQAQLNEGARIFTRRGDDWAARMPTISAALNSLPVKSVILDGELVSVDAKGQPGRAMLALGRRRGARSVWCSPTMASTLRPT
jgi:bifunctional non-homologous end joining protein LigD